MSDSKAKKENCQPKLIYFFMHTGAIGLYGNLGRLRTDEVKFVLSEASKQVSCL